MELAEDVVIVGAGIAGLATALGLHRIGIRSLVLESSSSLRITGFGLVTWTNGWKALDALGVADFLRRQHLKLDGIVGMSCDGDDSGELRTVLSFNGNGKIREQELRCLKRKLLLEALEKDLPNDTIRYSSKVVSIEESAGYRNLVHLADGTIIRTKVLIGCDGVNSVVAKWLGFKKAVVTGRLAIRACAEFKGNHHFGSKFMQVFGNGIRSGFIPCDEAAIYWFFSWTPSTQDEEFEDNPAKMKQFVLSKLEHAPDYISNVVKNTELDRIMSSPLSYRYPWELLYGKISKGTVCVAGDALHPMTPDIGQGGSAALEDAVVLARCLGEALSKKSSVETEEKDDKEEEHRGIVMALKKYANERRWRSFEFIFTAYMVGAILQSRGVVMTYLKKAILGQFLARILLKIAGFDCGKLSIS